MPNYERPELTACPKPAPRIFSKRDDKREREKHERQVNAAVDARDQKRCRCCRRKGNPNATTALGKIHRAHIRDASRGGPYEAWNLCSLCWLCHALEHAKQLHFKGHNANERIEFDLHEAAVVHIFGERDLPAHVHIYTDARTA